MTPDTLLASPAPHSLRPVESPTATPAPQSFERLVEALMANPDNSLKRIAAILEQNIPLKTQVIREANSLVYSLGKPIGSLSQAIACLGFNRCRDLIVAQLAALNGAERQLQRIDPPQPPQAGGGTLLRGRRTFRKERLGGLYPPKNRRHAPHFLSSVFE